MNINSFKILVASFCLMMFFVSNNVEARKGIPIVIYSTDDDIIEIKDAVVEDTIFLMGQDPAEVNMAEAKSNMPTNLKVGMMHSRFALFWMNVWTWDGQIVLFTDDTYYTVGISQAEAIAKYGKPFSYTYPTLALIAGGGLGIFLLFIIFGAISSSRRTSIPPKRSFAPEKESITEERAPKTTVPRPAVSFKKDFSVEELQVMYDDPEYRKALEIHDEQGLEAAINSLSENGMGKTEARYSMQALVDAVKTAQQEQEAAEQEEPQPV